MQNVKLEQTVVKILFHNPTLLSCEFLDVDDFFSDVSDVVEKMLILHRDGRAINETTLGVKYSVPTEDELTGFHDSVGALKSLSWERRLQTAPKKVTNIVLDGRISPQEKHMKLRKLIESYDNGGNRVEEYNIETQVKAYEEELFNGKMDEVISTGIRLLDRYIGGGMRKGDFVLIAGDTKNYKSTLLYNILLNVAKANLPIMLFSYEVNKKEVIEILVSMIAKIDSIYLKNKQIDGKPLSEFPELVARIKSAIREITRLPITIVDGNESLVDIKMMGLRKNPALVAVDYIQLMPDMKSNSNKVIAVEDISRDLKLMGKPDVLDCPIIGLSQFGKPKTGFDGPAKRSIHDLKWASSLSQDANLILFTQKIKKRTANGVENLIKISVEAQRNGVDETSFEVPLVPKHHTIGTQ